jgi:hypothetical protein
MSEEDKQEAREHLGRAGKQIRHAAKNTGRATKLGVAGAVDEVEEAVEGVVEEAKVVTPRLSARGLAVLSSDMGIGFFATAVSLYSANIAYHSFRAALQSRGRVVR